MLKQTVQSNHSGILNSKQEELQGDIRTQPEEIQVSKPGGIGTCRLWHKARTVSSFFAYNLSTLVNMNIFNLGLFK